MADIMTFPNTWEEFEKIYGITDIEQVYTNGTRLIPSFRVRQWLEHMLDQSKGKWIDEHEDGHGSWVGTCSQCHKTERVANFCPNCGCNMRGKDDDIHI